MILCNPRIFLDQISSGIATILCYGGGGYRTKATNVDGGEGCPLHIGKGSGEGESLLSFPGKK